MTGSAATPVGAGNTVSIRMYRDILGDCFLLRFKDEVGSSAKHVLIDCGVLLGTPGGPDRMKRVMRDILSVTNTIDVLVLTHEHWDHLSGFHYAKKEFARLQVEEVWMAWTEDGRDPDAIRLRNRRLAALEVVQKSYSELKSMQTSGSAGLSATLSGLEGLLAFAGIDPNAPAAGPRTTTADILSDIKKKGGKLRYLSPGQIVSLDDLAPGLAAYVLGPPREDRFLRKSSPTKAGQEVYQLGPDTADEDVFFVAAQARLDVETMSADDKANFRQSMPFGLRYLNTTDAQMISLGGRAVSDLTGTLKKHYESKNEEWRRIDSEWLGVAEQLALKLDNDTNNTSLALAFEIGSEDDRRVLLFPGDAQVGAWQSWSELEFKAPADPLKKISIDDLLSRTVVYKVAHHGSHNATIRERGLELMTHRDLVAMIPVDSEFALKSKGWNMPFPALLSRLEELTAGRVIRGDRDIDRSRDRKDQVRASFHAKIDEIRDSTGPLAFEYTIPF